MRLPVTPTDRHRLDVDPGVPHSPDPNPPLSPPATLPSTRARKRQHSVSPCRTRSRVGLGPARARVLDAADTRAVGRKRTGTSTTTPDTGPSYYPTPPPSREGIASPSPRPTRNTSKYFTARSSSPVLTIPVYIPSSDFEYPPPDVPAHDPGLSDDLVVMLRRLKPILVQESVRDDPWKVLVAVRLLNVTTGKAAIPVFCKIMSRWPTPRDLVHAPQDALVQLLRPLGLYNKRARWLREVSARFIEDQQALDRSWTSYVRYPGVGPYALDSLRIFCEGDWKGAMPSDKELVRYLRWRWAVEEGKIWYPDGRGVIGDVNVPYLMTLVDELAAHYDGAIGGEGYMYHFGNDLVRALSGDVS